MNLTMSPCVNAFHFSIASVQKWKAPQSYADLNPLSLSHSDFAILCIQTECGVPTHYKMLLYQPRSYASLNA